MVYSIFIDFLIFTDLSVFVLCLNHGYLNVHYYNFDN